MIKSVSLGMPRIGKDAELIKATRSFLSKGIQFSDLEQIGKKIRSNNIKIQKDNNIDFIPTNDFSFFDHILDATCLIGNIPRRFFWEGGSIPTQIYFTMITGQQKDKFDIIPLTYQHFLNTNYRYLVHEFSDPLDLSYSDNKPILDFLEAKTEHKIISRPVLVGPMAYFSLGRIVDQELTRQEILSEIVNVYSDVILNFIRIGVKDVQIDEYFLSTELTLFEQEDCIKVYKKLSSLCEGKIKIHLTVGGNSIRNNLDFISQLPVQSIHFDLQKNLEHISDISKKLDENVILSLGVVDAQNIFKTDLSKTIESVSKVIDVAGSDRIYIGPTSSLFLCPHSVEKNTNSSDLNKLSFAKEKVEEISIIKNVINEGRSKYESLIKNNLEIFKEKKVEISIPKIDLKAEKQNDSSLIENDLQPFSTMLVGYFNLENTNNDNTKKKGKNGKDQDKENENNVSIQDKLGVDIISSGIPYTNADLFEWYIDKISGLKLLSGYFIQSSGLDYYSPAIINSPKELLNGYSKLSSLVFENESSYASLTTKPFKLTLPGPISMSHRIFLTESDISRNDLQIIFTYILSGVLKSSSKIKNLKVLEFDETDLMTNIDTENVTKFSMEIERVGILFKFLMEKMKTYIQKSFIPMIYFSDYDFTEYIEELMKIPSYGMLFSSCKSRHFILENFISYKHDRIIGIGVVDASDARSPTSNQIMNEIKKVNMHLDEKHTVLIPDSGFKNKSQNCILKTLQNFIVAVKKYKEKIKEDI